MKRLLGLAVVPFLLVGLSWAGSVEQAKQETLTAHASKYPAKDITWIIPYGPGGLYDLYSRMIGDKLPNALSSKVRVVPTNIEGGGGLVGVAQVFKAKPDGYTIGISYLPSPLVTQMIEGSKKTGFEFNKFTFLSVIATQDLIIYVGANTPYRSLKDLQGAKRVKFASTGVGAKTWLDEVMVGKLFGINASIVPGYKSSGEIKIAVQRGDVDASIHDTATIRQELKDGTFRPILSLGTQRDPMVPDVPTAAEVGVPEIAGLQRMVRIVIAPPGLPKEIEQALSDGIWQILHSKEFNAWAEKAEVPVNPLRGKEVQDLVTGTVKTYEKYIDFIKAKLAE